MVGVFCDTIQLNICHKFALFNEKHAIFDKYFIKINKWHSIDRFVDL